MVRKFLNKAYGICQKDFLLIRKGQNPCGRIQCSKQHVIRQNV